MGIVYHKEEECQAWIGAHLNNKAEQIRKQWDWCNQGVVNTHGNQKDTATPTMDAPND
jgi:hypothetical protein